MVALVLSVLGDPDSIEVLCNIVTNPHEDLAIRHPTSQRRPLSKYCSTVPYSG